MKVAAEITGIGLRSPSDVAARLRERAIRHAEQRLRDGALRARARRGFAVEADEAQRPPR